MIKLKQHGKLIILSILAILLVCCYSVGMYKGMETSFAMEAVEEASNDAVEDENLQAIEASIAEVPAAEVKSRVPVIDDISDNNTEEIKHIDSHVDETVDSVPATEIVPKAPIVSEEEKAREIAEREAEEARIEKLKNRIPNYSRSDIASLDLTKPSNITVDDLKAIGRYSGLRGLEKAFVGAEKKYGVNCLFVYGIAVIESGGGAKCYRPNNMFGFMGKSFSSKSEAIYYVTRALSQNYLSEGGRFYYGKTAAAVNTKYCTGKTWHGKIENVMYKMYQAARANNLAKYE